VRRALGGDVLGGVVVGHVMAPGGGLLLTSSRDRLGGLLIVLRGLWLLSWTLLCRGRLARLRGLPLALGAQLVLGEIWLFGCEGTVIQSGFKIFVVIGGPAGLVPFGIRAHVCLSTHY
jgi:hypothetical protein